MHFPAVFKSPVLVYCSPKPFLTDTGRLLLCYQRVRRAFASTFRSAPPKVQIVSKIKFPRSSETYPSVQPHETTGHFFNDSHCHSKLSVGEKSLKCKEHHSQPKYLYFVADAFFKRIATDKVDGLLPNRDLSVIIQNAHALQSCAPAIQCVSMNTMGVATLDRTDTQQRRPQTEAINSDKITTVFHQYQIDPEASDISAAKNIENTPGMQYRINKSLKPNSIKIGKLLCDVYCSKRNAAKEQTGRDS